MKINNIVIIGAGASGLGMAVFLKKSGFEDVLMVEKSSIGESFKNWPKETKFISPSFTSNFFGLADLNAVSPDTSPAYNLSTEHPSGLEYATYLENCVKHFNLKIKLGVEVISISKDKEIFTINTKVNNLNKKIYAKYIIWAAGEYMYPDTNSFEGQELGIHFANIKSYENFKSDEYIIIGANEAGMDACINLLAKNKKITLIDGTDPIGHISSDSSTSLSPYTRDKFDTIYSKVNRKNLHYIKNIRVESVKQIKIKNSISYEINLENSEKIITKNKPIICSGFEGSAHKLIKEYFTWNGNRPLLTDKDESTLTTNLFLAGPHIVHDKAIFCFIYKFRQRFAIVAEEIFKREAIFNNVNSDKYEKTLKSYKKAIFYLDDLSGCCQDCSC